MVSLLRPKKRIMVLPYHEKDRMVAFQLPVLGLGSGVLGGALEDLDGAAVVDPFEEEFGGVEAVEGEADAAVGGGEMGDGGVSVDEDVAVDLDAVGHGGALVAVGVVHAGAEGADAELAGGGAAVAAGAEVGLEDEAGALPGAELLGGEVNFDAFGAGDEGAVVAAAAN